MDNVKVENISSQKVIEVTFKHEHKQKNEGFLYYIPSKIFTIFARYLEEICKDTVATGNLQFLKNWNKIGKRRVQNTRKNNVNMLHFAAWKILKKRKNGYSSHCWRSYAATNLADAGVSLMNLKWHGQWVSDGVVEGYITNSLPLRQECLNRLLPAEGKEEVGQVNSDDNNLAIKRFDLYIDLSNNANLPVTPPVENGELILYVLNQFDIPDLRIENMDVTNTDAPVLQAPVNQPSSSTSITSFTYI